MEKDFQNIGKEFGEKLRFLRRKNGYSQAKLAELLGVTKQTIINYEKGETLPPSARIPLIIEVLDTTSEQLFGEENLSTDSNTELLELYANKAVVTAQIQYFSELVGDSEENQIKFRKLLLKLLDIDGKSTEELIQLITSYFDNKIKKLNVEIEKDAHLLAYNSIHLDIKINSPELYGKFEMIDKLALMKES